MNIGKDILNKSAKLAWLFVDMNSYFASCEQQLNPALRDNPVIVVPAMTDSTCAIAASYEAKKFGIKTGTKVWEAKKRCPGLIVVQAQFKHYVEFHQKFTDAIKSCIPVEEVVSIDEVACKLDKIQCQPEEAKELALRIKAAIREKVGAYLTCSIGIASNQLLAKLASDMQKPNGLVVLLPQEMPQPILHLSPNDICGIGPNMNVRLQNAGIHSMGDLWNADAQHLRRIWNGITGLRFHQVLHGADLPNPLPKPRRSMGHQHVLAPHERNKKNATPIMRQLLVRVAQRVRDEGFYATRMLMDIKWDKKLGHHIDMVTFKETQDTAYLLPILMKLWGKVPNLRPLRIGVTLSGLAAKEHHQPDLFDVPKPNGLMKAMDAVNDRFGKGTVRFGESMPQMTSKIAFHRIPGLDEF